LVFRFSLFLTLIIVVSSVCYSFIIDILLGGDVDFPLQIVYVSMCLGIVLYLLEGLTGYILRYSALNFRNCTVYLFVGAYF